MIFLAAIFYCCIYISYISRYKKCYYFHVLKEINKPFKMGIDNEALLIFGCTFDFATAIRIGEIDKLLVRDDDNNINEDNQYDFVDLIQMEEVESFNNMFPGLYIGCTSPWYNSDCDDWYFYISLIEPRDNYTSEELIAVKEEKLEMFIRCLERYDITECNDPKLLALSHIG